MNAATESTSLKRVVGVGGLGFNVVNLTIASGIFGLPAILAGILGPQAILAYFVCAVLFGLVGLCFAEAGSRVGSAGGLYAYASVPFGPIVGGIAGTLAGGSTRAPCWWPMLPTAHTTVMPARTASSARCDRRSVR